MIKNVSFLLTNKNTTPKIPTKQSQQLEIKYSTFEFIRNNLMQTTIECTPNVFKASMHELCFSCNSNIL